MTEAERQAAIADHVQWCEGQREQALAQIDMYTNGGSRLSVSHGPGPLVDITDETVADHRRVVADMDRIIAAYGRFNA